MAGSTCEGMELYRFFNPRSVAVIGIEADLQRLMPLLVTPFGLLDDVVAGSDETVFGDDEPCTDGAKSTGFKTADNGDNPVLPFEVFAHQRLP